MKWFDFSNVDNFVDKWDQYRLKKFINQLELGKFLPKAPTIQKFTSSSGTYTTPSGVLYIEVEMCGGGGGGGQTGGATGGTGGDTTFGSSLLTAHGGLGGQNQAGSVQAQATATISAPAFGVTFNGAQGMNMGGTSPAGSNQGIGGSTPFFGGGAASSTSVIPNTGGGGRADGNNGSVGSSFGGNSGAYLKAKIVNPSATYSYAVGASGAAGGGGASAGAAGIIIVTEYYQ